MADLFNEVWIAVQSIFTLTGVIYIFGGAAIGLILGALPGLNGGVLTLLLLPIMYKLEPALAIGLLVAVHVGSETSGCIGSILFGIPGTASSIATVWDGYEFTKKGDPVRPLSAAFSASVFGNIPGFIIAMFTCVTLGRIAVKLGPWEYASMCFAAVAMIISLSKGNIVKGLLSVGLAIMISSIGKDAVYGSKRLTFGSPHLYDGINVMTLMLGAFGLSIILIEFGKNAKMNSAEKVKVSRFRFPTKDILANKWNILRSFITGVVIGFIPGMGGPTSSVVAYSTEKNLSKNKENWGKGEIGGVIAPETANNASISGAMIPMAALGVPGDMVMAQFMVALTCMGISAGPTLIRDRPDIVYMLFVAGLISAIFIFIVQVVFMPVFPSLLKVPYHYLYPVILSCMLLGAYQVTGSVYGIIIGVAACVLGVLMDVFSIPKEPFIMTAILAPMLERKIRLGMNYSTTGAMEFFTRPVSLIFILIGVGMLVWCACGDSVSKKLKERTAKKTAAKNEKL